MAADLVVNKTKKYMQAIGDRIEEAAGTAAAGAAAGALPPGGHPPSHHQQQQQLRARLWSFVAAYSGGLLAPDCVHVCACACIGWEGREGKWLIVGGGSPPTCPPRAPHLF